jgi:RNA recognition motif-containing protein
MSKEARLKATIYIGGLDNAVTPEVLQQVFIPFGDIVDISLPKPELPASKDLHRGFGYVEFESAADAKEAIDNMDQSELYGRVIRVAQAKPTQKDMGFEGLGSRVPVWEQVCQRLSPHIHDINSILGRLDRKIRCRARGSQRCRRISIKAGIRRASRSNARLRRTGCCGPEARVDEDIRLIVLFTT